MPQIKIYGHRAFLNDFQQIISDAVHQTTVQILGLPVEKRFHRFFKMERDDFIHPNDRSEQYLILEISMIQGRSAETKKQYIRHLYSALSEKVGISVQDVEITLFENPKENWGIRGLPADELSLNYKIEK